MKNFYSFLKIKWILSFLMAGILMFSLFSASTSYGQGGEDAPFSLAINCGSDTDYTALDGTVYVADVNFDGGRTDNSFTGPKYTGDILGTDDDVLYQTYRATGYIELDDFFYNIPLDNGTYNVTLKFADYQQWQRNAGNLIIEGTQVFTSFLVQEVAGDPFVAFDTTLTVIVEDGELNMQFINDDVSVGDFFINGLLIEEDVPFNLAINCGSDTDYTAVDGTVYVADVNFDGGRTDNSFTGPKYTGDILGTDDDVLYQTYRATGYIELDDFFYNIPLDNGTYNVTLKFADYQQWQRNAGNLIIEGTQVFTSFLVQEVAGDPFVAYDTTLTVIVEDGELNMQFINDDVSVGDFFINGLLIEEDVPFSLGINCGSDKDYTALDGKEYVADIYGTGGTADNQWNGPKYDPNDPVLGTDDDSLYVYFYRTEYPSLTDFSYDIPLNNGTYEVTLKFWDFHQWQRNAGNVIIEGTQVLTSFEPPELFTALDTTFTVRVEDGELNMHFINDDVSVGFFCVNGIYIQELDEIIYSLETTAENGTINLDPVGGTYTEGTEVTLTAEPDYGWEFVRWNGDLEGVEDSTASTITVLMDKEKSITATFAALPMFSLTTNVTNGLVYLDPAPDSSGGRYYEGTEVMLVAKPYVNYIFNGWSGDLSGNENPVTVVMDKDLNITAEMLLNVFPLTIDATNGSVNVFPQYGEGVFDGGTGLVLQAIPDDGYRFYGWEGDLSGSQNPTSLVMDSAIHVVAVFELIPESYALTTVVTNGTITLDPESSDDGTYEDGTVVTVTAIPDDGYEFTGWSGDLTGSDNPTSITIDGDKSITAEFELIISIGDNYGIEQSNLEQNYPNPFSVQTKIPYQLDKAAPVQLIIYNILGEKINTLVNMYQQPGSYEVEWNVVDDNGQRLSNGVYFYRLVIDSEVVKTQKAIVSQ